MGMRVSFRVRVSRANVVRFFRHPQEGARASRKGQIRLFLSPPGRRLQLQPRWAHSVRPPRIQQWLGASSALISDSGRHDLSAHMPADCPCTHLCPPSLFRELPLGQEIPSLGDPGVPHHSQSCLGGLGKVTRPHW